MSKGNVLLLLLCTLCPSLALLSQPLISERNSGAVFPLVSPAAATAIYTDPEEVALVQKAASFLQQDINAVTGKTIPIVHEISGRYRSVIIIGTAGSRLVRQLAGQKKTDLSRIDKWEGYLIQTIDNPVVGVQHALLIAGNDRRGAAFGVFDVSAQLGVSPWYWWADVPINKKKEVYAARHFLKADAPLVKYRGIFINDEAPALSGWTKEKFGGFNHLLYERVFELILRLKGNYIWPAMWGNAFYDDDSLNIKTAEEFGIVVGTSHHEPLMRAHDEWRRYGKGKWDYDSNETRLKEFWRGGMQRATNEKIVSIGMRGDGDAPMSRETATALLERIVKDQRSIIEEVTGKPAAATPQLWVLYKEVQDYYDKGMRVPDDVTLLLCDDNWGNIRKLPRPGEQPRAGGYGIYYHFDYVGGPRNYKWVNTNPLPRVWEQMHLAWEYDARQIWIVNVGDIKPMELPISFFLDYAWNPTRIGPNDVQPYTEKWSAGQFGNLYAKKIAGILARYAMYNGRRKPEMLDDKTYSLHNFDEFATVVREYNSLLAEANKINDQLDPRYRDAYFQLVLHPVRACANLNEMYYYVALNKEAAREKLKTTNEYAAKVKSLYVEDSLITVAYHRLNNGKWNHMMDQTHIGYTYWQQPVQQKMPNVTILPADSLYGSGNVSDSGVVSALHLVPNGISQPVFFECDSYVSINADHFSKAVNTNGITWTVLPGLGRTGSAVTSFPVTAKEQQPGPASPRLEYEVYVYDTGAFRINTYFSPTLNFQGTEKGLQYAISVDDEAPQVISINAEDRATGSGIWNKWVGESIIIRSSRHSISKTGKHTVKYWMVNNAVVLQKIVLDFGNAKQSYLGPPETIFKQPKN